MGVYPNRKFFWKKGFSRINMKLIARSHAGTWERTSNSAIWLCKGKAKVEGKD
jgi:hypothetical protein